MNYKHHFVVAGLVGVVAAGARDSISGISWGPQRLDLFGADSNHNVFHKYYTAFGWGPDDPKHGNLELHVNAHPGSAVSAVSWASNRMDYVFVDKERNVMHKYWDGTGWGPSDTSFENLGSGMNGKLAVAAWGPDRLDIVGISDTLSYGHKAWTGSSWYPSDSAWEDLGGRFNSTPAVVSYGAGRLDIFGINAAGNILHKFWDGYQWNPVGKDWEDLGGHKFTGAPVASSMYTNRFDVWAVSEDGGDLYHLFWDGFQYQGWENLGGNFSTAPQVAHWSANRIDILGIESGKNPSYKYKFWDGHQWNGWYDKGGPFASEPALVSIGENNLNLFGVDKDGKLKLQVWDGSQWLPDSDNWYELGDTKFKDKGSVVSHTDGSERLLGGDEQQVKIELKFRA